MDCPSLITRMDKRSRERLLEAVRGCLPIKYFTPLRLVKKISSSKMPISGVQRFYFKGTSNNLTHTGSNHVESIRTLTTSLNNFNTRRRVRYYKIAHPPTLLKNAQQRRLYPQPIVFSPREVTVTLFTHRCIHYDANTDVILTSIQRPRSLTPRDDPEPITCPRREF